MNNGRNRGGEVSEEDRRRISEIAMKGVSWKREVLVKKVTAQCSRILTGMRCILINERLLPHCA